MKIMDINGKEIYFNQSVEKIVIYGHGVKLYEIDSSFFNSYRIIENKYGHESIEEIYAGGPVSITLKNGVKDARKENLTRKDNYTLPYETRYTRGKTLYIHESEIEVTYIGELTAYETEEERNYVKCFVLKFNGPVTFERLHLEHIPCDGTWTLPNGARWSSSYGTEQNPCFDTYDYSKSLFAKKRPGINPNEKGVIKRWKTYETIVDGAEIVTKERFYTKTEYSKERERKNKIAKVLNDSGLFKNSFTFSHYDIDKLEKVLNISIKEGGIDQ